MQNTFEKLMKFCSKPANSEHMGLSLDTFFENIDEWMDCYHADPENSPEIQEFYSMIYPMAMEYFFSANYDQDESGEYWNVIDRFLATKPIGIPPQDVAFLTALRHSKIGIYEITEINGESVAIKDMYNDKNINLSECDIHELAKVGDIYASRVIDTGSITMLSDGNIRLSPETASLALELIKEKMAQIPAAIAMAEAAGEDISPEYVQHIAESMLAREIVETWVANDIMEMEEETNAA